MPEPITEMVTITLLLWSGRQRQRITIGSCMAAFLLLAEAVIPIVEWDIMFFPSCYHRWSICRWFVGDVSEAAVLPTYPAASLDRPSLEDVL